MRKHKWDIIVPLLAILTTVAVGVTVRVPLNLRAFNAGELSPLMNARSDYPKYATGAKTLQNMLVRPQGPVERRPGTKYIASVKDATDTIRLIPFEYSTSDAYVLELGDLYFRIYRNGGQVVDVNSDPVEVVTVWDSNDIFELQFVQDANTMRVVHPDYQPYKIQRTSHTAWTCAAITFVKGPFQDENTDTTSTLTPSATTGSITIDGSGTSYFDADHVGSLWEISYIVAANSVSDTWSLATTPPAAGTSLTVQKDRYFDWTTSGQWNGTIELQRSYDAGVTWETVTSYSSNNDSNIQYSGQETWRDAIYRGQLQSGYTVTGRSFLTSTITARSFKLEGVVEVTGFTDANTVTADVKVTLGGTAATYMWAEGYWSDYRGWPRTVEHYEQRCVYGGSDSFPQTLWGSIVASQDSDYDEFDDGDADDDDAWTFVLPGMNPIQWLKGQEYLMVGTTNGVGRFGSADEPTTPTSVEYRMQAHIGSDYIQAVHGVDGIFFVERGGQKIREVGYTSSSERYIADDMTILAEHVTGTGVTQIDMQYRPDPILWCVRDDGQLLSFTYHKRHDIASWARHTAAGTTFDSVAVIPGTDEDVVYTVASRTIDSNSVSYVENFSSVDWGTDQNDCWFVDSGVTDINGLSHLEGESVSLFADGRPIGDYTVSSGSISPPGSYTNHVVGLPFVSIYESMPLVATTNQPLTSALLKTAVLNVTLDFYETLACDIGTDSTNQNVVQFSDDDFATTVDAYTGLKVVTFPRGYSRDMTIYIDCNEPVPMKLRGINPQIEVMTN